MASRRMERVEQLLKEELGIIFQRGLKDPRIGFVTVTGVKASPDLSHAKVYLSVMGSEKAKKDTMDGVVSAAGYIQRELGARVRLRHTPRLEFALDDSADRGFHIMEILNKIEAEKRDEQ
ncbi:MAG: 30S ribosome-binding factor RbfA [Chlamydiota bacterium]